jgi:hypothetical protein
LYVVCRAIAILGTDILTTGRAVRAVVSGPLCDAREDGLEHFWKQPQHIRVSYDLLTAEKGRWIVDQNLVHQVQMKDPPISLGVFFKLCKELGIPSQLQLDMVATEKPTGGSFFVWS